MKMQYQPLDQRFKAKQKNLRVNEPFKTDLAIEKRPHDKKLIARDDETRKILK